MAKRIFIPILFIAAWLMAVQTVCGQAGKLAHDEDVLASGGTPDVTTMTHDGNDAALVLSATDVDAVVHPTIHEPPYDNERRFRPTVFLASHSPRAPPRAVS